jgi:hypothetical protein
MAMKISVEPVEVRGHCPAGLTPDDDFEIEGMRLENPRGSRICFLALSQLPIGMGVWQLQAGRRFFSHVSCPGCTTQLAEENRVVFLLSHADKRRLSRLISAYLSLSKSREETQAAQQLKAEAIAHQSRGAFEEAACKMAAAIDELARGAQHDDRPGALDR